MIGNTLKKQSRSKAITIYERVDNLSRGLLSISVYTVQGIGRTRAFEAAASIAYYALFSLFPLFIFLVAIGSYILESEQVQQQVLAFVGEALPASQDLVAQNIQQVLRLRGAVGLAGTVGLLWSASSVFTALVRNVNRAWQDAEPRSFLKGRLVALLMVGILVGLLIASFFFSTLFGLLTRFNVPLLGDVSIYDTFAWALLSRLVPWMLIFAMFQGLYRWVPNTEVKWSEAFWGALVAASAWEIIKTGFGWYLSSGLSRYQLVYGSLGAVIALMLWIYLAGLVILFGAHLSAAITRYNRSKKKRRKR
jgi:membrane protein